MNVSIFSQKAYEHKSNWILGENKPNQSQLPQRDTQYAIRDTKYKPNQTQFQTGQIVYDTVSSIFGFTFLQLTIYSLRAIGGLRHFVNTLQKTVNRHESVKKLEFSA
ncbi:MAG: hypothetical protein ACYS6W_16940 [Planctomycetota bacterium]